MRSIGPPDAVPGTRVTAALAAVTRSLADHHSPPFSRTSRRQKRFTAPSRQTDGPRSDFELDADFDDAIRWDLEEVRGAARVARQEHEQLVAPLHHPEPPRLVDEERQVGQV